VLASNTLASSFMIRPDVADVALLHHCAAGGVMASIECSNPQLKLVALLPCQSTSSIRARWTILTTANHYRALMFR
jgi:hypothetical protein